MFWFTLMLSPTSSWFFPVRYAPRHPNKLAFTSLHCSISNYTFDRRDSDLINLHKHDSNKYQTKAFVICDHKSDQTRSATHVNKTYLIWLMYWLLFNHHYQHCTNQKLRSWANAVFQNRGVCGQAFPSLPSPSPIIPFFFCSCPNFLDELARKRLLCRLTRIMVDQMNRWIHSGQGFIGLLFWSTMIRVISDHWSWSGSSQRNLAP